MASLLSGSVCFLYVLSALVPADSTQQFNTVYRVCARGYFLSDQETCLPCNCKGHADSCEDITGICIDCRDHTLGDFCELCEDRFLPVFLPDGTFMCRPCACPLSLESNNFAAHCDRRGEFLRCVCQDGYAGHYCERCAPGYYGNPMELGNSCKKCDCNGNSDPNLIFNECHNVTGKCLNCWGDTAGDNCERCAPGFYGDAISAKDCQECQCNKCGTASCDDRSGVCHCKPGVTGQLCDRCEDGHSGFCTCMGCRRCECASAALRATCHPLTHSCQCRPGAGGRYCERCLPGFWDYSPSGCRKCDCPEENCDLHTGECLPELSQISECNISCDACIWNLIGDIRQSNKTLDQVRNSVLNISTGAAANDRLKYYNYTAHRLQAQFRGWRKNYAMMSGDTDVLEEETQNLLTDMDQFAEEENEVQNLGKQVDQETLNSSTRAKTLTANLSSLNVLIEDMIRDWELYGVYQELDPQVKLQKLAEAERILGWMRKLNLSPKEPLATDESSEAHELLRRVRSFDRNLMTTQGRLPPMQEVLGRFTSKLLQAQDLLSKAEDALKQAINKYKSNQLKLQRREAQQQRLKDIQDGVDQTIVNAAAVLSEANHTVLEVEDVITNVREQHAEIDGARVLLERRTEKISQSDRELVLRAEDHADQLQRHAEEPQHNLKGSDANGHVQKALNAFNVYDNIVKSVDDANITSLTALNISSRTHGAVDKLSSQLNLMRSQSAKVLNEASSLHFQQQDSESIVLDNKKYIEETNEMMDGSSKKIAKIITEINAIHTDRTPKRLQFTQEVAEGTLNRSAEVLEKVTPILKRVEQWDGNMKSEAYSAAAFDRTVLSAGEAVKDLSAIVPELLSKLRVVEEKKPVNNVTTSIMKIRGLIAQARSVAKKVQVSMKFDGQSAVEVHPHTNLDELKTVTSISFYIRVDPDKDPIEDRFLLYLGDKQGKRDYMGLAIKNDNLVYVYKLGEEEVEIPLSSKPVSSWPPVFNFVKVERLGRHGKVFLTVPSQDTTAEQKFIQKGEPVGTDTLFDLDPKDMVFIVGGVPPGVTVPPILSLAPFVGCIELETLNNDVISLYNFKQLHKMDVKASAPCPRHKLAFSQSRVTSYLFDGTGYALVNNIERRGKIGVVTRFDIEVRTVANNGILFLMVNETNFFVLELKNGFLRLMYDFGFANGPVIIETNLAKLQINDARYHEVSVIYHHSKKIILLVDRSHVKSFESEKKPLPFSDIYIGGAPSRILQSRPELTSLIGLKGCVKGFQFQKEDFNLLEEQGTIGISSGCPEESFMSHKAYFTGNGYLSSSDKISPFQSFEGGLSFKTLQPSGLLFYHRDGSDEFSLSLENGAVVLQAKGTRVKSQKKHYSDGRSHFLVASVTNQKYEIVIDDKDKQDKKKPSSTSQSDNTPKAFYYGGSTSSSILNLTGCISYAYISRQDRDIEPEDFQRYSENVQASLQDCPIERPPSALLKDSRDSSRRSAGHSRKVGRDESGLPHGLKSNPLNIPEKEEASCYLSSRPRATPHANHYGGSAHSRHEYTGIASAIKHESHFSLSLKTRSAFGLIFYLADASGENSMALFLTHARLVFTFSSGQSQVRIRSKEKYNDGQWHDIIFIRAGNMGRMLIDGLTVLEDRAPGRNTSLLVQDPLYVGGVPPHQAMKNIQRTSVSSFTGCVRSLQLNGRSLTSASHSFGVTPCYEGPSEPGTYFAEEGGYVLLDDSFHFGSSFKMAMEVRPRVASGVLLHVFMEQKEYLTVYIYQSQVVVVVNNGIAEFSTHVSPTQEICDGNWHKITVIRDGSVLQLDVDSEVNHVVGSVSDAAQSSSSPVFIGGAPDSMLSHSLLSRRGFTGCMRSVSVNETPVSFSKAVLVSGSVGVGACPSA
ncbi:laminin subunit alpha-4 precursor [Danio rerio]|uniref:Laminin alpha 4 n=1 Tax=Danio rerio TaxID=7955 RepID=Q2TJF5_DANRE|nr:laminin subunit alpha-4 precursor [Danio rerio]AAX55656.1 laminin alpha 4 [Danio rerio]|eukprot:NP_001034154.1 laminin subunit alpha-4 precursor [Danio rerio]